MASDPFPGPGADSNLIFGILALQMGFIDRDALVAALNARVLDKGKPLGDVLVEQGVLTATRRALLEPLVDEHLHAHENDPQKSLAALSSLGSTGSELAKVADPEVQASLASVSAERTTDEDPYGTTGRGTEESWGRADLRYRILRPHARGGLGEVYVAQDRELNREVALKEIRLDSAHQPDSRARFLREAEITGRLEHPGVVPVYGLGHYPDGRPFYAMRFIKGDSLKDAIERFHADGAGSTSTRSSADRNLEMRQLLGRFIDLCNAIAYAHSRGVLHRDIKPGNVMLGKYGETLVVDWGLAKPVGSKDGAALDEPTIRPAFSDDARPTQMGQVVGTPAYMSPEQAAGKLDELGLASDVYSLGATLYSLLTGKPPFEGKVLNILDLVAKGRLARPRAVAPEVPLPLEGICLKAMALRREDRYASATALANDIEHWLADEAVSVYREPWIQRLGRWARRHRGLAASSMAGVAVAAVSLAVVSLLIGRKNTELAAANTREHAAADLARQTIEDMTSEDALRFLQTQKELRPEQRHFLEQALAYYQKAIRQEAPGEEGQAQQARAYHRMGNLQHRLGFHVEAEATYRAAVLEYRRLATEHPLVPEYHQGLAWSHNNLGLLLRELGKGPEGEKEFRDGLAEREQLAAEHPEVAAYSQDMAKSLNNLGILLADLGKESEAEKAFRTGLAVRSRLAAEHPQVPEYRRDLAASHANLGVLLAGLGKRPEAAEEYRAALTEDERLVADHPQMTVYRQDLARAHNNLGLLLAADGKWPGAEKEYRAALADFQRLAEDHPQVPAYRQELARGHDNLGNLLGDLGKEQEAEKEYRAALLERDRLVTEHPQVPEYRGELATSHSNLGILLAELGKRSDAEKEYRAAIIEGERLAAEQPQVPEYRVQLAMSHNNLSTLLAAIGKRLEAEKECRAGLVIRERLAAERPHMPDDAVLLARSYGNLADFYNQGGQPAEALDWYAKTLATLEGALSKLGNDFKGRETLRDSHRGRALALTKLGRYTEAIRDLDRALDLDEGSAAGKIRASRAKTLAQAGEVARASADAEELLKAGSLNGDALYGIASVFSLASAKTKEPDQAERYAGRAVTVLRQAVAKGYTNIEQMKRDTDLDPLRQRDDFKKLLQELGAKKNPPGK
jgi:serine/threonine-protein kinase